MGICFSFIKQRQKGRINDRAEKRPAPCWGEREGSNLIWLEEDMCVCVCVCVCVVRVRAHVCVRTCMAAMHSVRGLWEWDRRDCAIEWSLQSQKQWGVSPDA